MAYILLAETIASMLVCYFLAKRRGLSRRYWLIVAAIIGPLAIPILFLAKNKSKDEQD